MNTACSSRYNIKTYRYKVELLKFGKKSLCLRHALLIYTRRLSQLIKYVVLYWITLKCKYNSAGVFKDMTKQRDQRCDNLIML